MGYYLKDMSVRLILGRTNLISARDLLAVPNIVGGYVWRTTTHFDTFRLALQRRKHYIVLGARIRRNYAAQVPRGRVKEESLSCSSDSPKSDQN